jgi:hypothetical protein
VRRVRPRRAALHPGPRRRRPGADSSARADDAESSGRPGGVSYSLAVVTPLPTIDSASVFPSGRAVWSGMEKEWMAVHPEAEMRGCSGASSKALAIPRCGKYAVRSVQITRGGISEHVSKRPRRPVTGRRDPPRRRCTGARTLGVAHVPRMVVGHRGPPQPGEDQRVTPPPSRPPPFWAHEPYG